MGGSQPPGSGPGRHPEEEGRPLLGGMSGHSEARAECPATWRQQAKGRRLHSLERRVSWLPEPSIHQYLQGI